ncbi:MAG TPA: ribosome maturation factor RimP [Actinomycetota bacterium]|jgi:ribosome maturation factor RimP|nr:ribosome maturation factor RimP [Actinomycetota bacterium]
MATLPPRVQDLAERVAAAHGVELLEAQLRRRGRSPVLSVVLDADAPVEADVVERVSKELSHLLDEDDPLPGSYILEVTTPGLDRPLRTARDFRRQRGHEVRVTRAQAGSDATTSVQGIVVAVDDQAVTLDADGGQLRLPLSEVVRGTVVLPW